MSNDETVFVLTGCTSGIGRHMADVLVTRGDRVVATARNLDVLAEHAKARAWPADRACVRQLDVRDPQAWERVLEEAVAMFGRLDVLMNFAGVIHPGPVHQATGDEVHEQIDVNVKGTIFGTQAAAGHMIRQGRGHIINVSSFCGLAPIPGVAVYSASKYAVRGFSLAAAQELRPFGVRVTVVCPDAVQTRMLDGQLAYDASAVIFSNRRPLTVENLTRVILGRVLKRRPLEVYVPRLRGRLARIMDLHPLTTRLSMPILRWRGLRHLRIRRNGR
jgi:3-oxoacyl-[acyl-carrier protein] reductase